MGNAVCGGSAAARAAEFVALNRNPSLSCSVAFDDNMELVMPSGCPGWLLCLMFPLLLLLSPLLLLEVMILFFCGCALPPLSCALEEAPAKGTFDINSIPPQNEIPDELMSKTSKVSACCCRNFVAADGDTEEMIKTTCELMLKANVTASTLDMPADLRGIFWMKGNSVAEELACIAWGTSEPTGENGSITTRVNGFFGWTYLDTALGKVMAPFDGNMGTGKSTLAGMNYFIFGDAGLSHGAVYGSDSYDYSKLSSLFRMGHWTMERLPGPGVAWKRGCYWFPRWFGKRLEFGSYDLVKIMDTNGEVMQPHYDEFVSHMKTSYPNSRLMLEAPP